MASYVNRSKGSVAPGRIFVYFAKKKLSTTAVDECDRRVSPWQNFVRPYQTSKKPRQNQGLADFLSSDFIALFCLFSVTKFISTFHTPLTHDQKCAKLKSASVQQAWTEKILLAFRTKISIFSGFRSSWRWAVHVITGRWTGTENTEREFLFNYYGSQIFPSQIRNEELSSRSISPEHTSSIAEASAATQQKKKQYETLKRANNLIDVLGIKVKIVTSQCDRV